MTSRGFLTTIGATALGVGIVIGGAATPAAFAQETTPAVEAPAQTEQAADPEAWRAQAYSTFVAALASELSVDDAAVDEAIRTALKQQVTELEAAGNLETDLASELQTMIDEAEAPLMLGMGGFGGRGGMHGFGGHGGFEGRGGEHRGPKGGFDGRDRDEDTTRRGTLPAIDDATGQSTPANETPAEIGANA